MVIAIFATLSLMALASLSGSRNVQVSRDAAEQIKSEIRKVQIRAISTEGICPGNLPPKMWGLNLRNNGEVVSYYWCLSDLSWHQHETLNWPFPMVGLTINPAARTSICYVYNAPYGRFYPIDSCQTATTMILDRDREQSYRPATVLAGNTTITTNYNGVTFNVSVTGDRGATEIE